MFAVGKQGFGEESGRKESAKHFLFGANAGA